MDDQKKHTDESKAWELIAKEWGQAIRPEEAELLQTTLDEEKLDRVVETLSAVSITQNITGEQLKESSDKTWTKVSNTIEYLKPQKASINYWKYAAVAASITLLLISSLFVYITHSQQPSFAMQVISTSYGETKEIVLPDGSRVRLNAGSQLVYPEQFSDASREVFISGQAFFDITRNKEKPFIVNSEKVAVKVFGTRFDVKSYQEEEDIEITLESGSIGFDMIDNKFKKTTLLSPNQRAKISRKTGNVSIVDVSSDYYTGWKEGKFNFHAQTFESIASSLERTYNVKIDIHGEKLKKEIYTGKFENGESIEQIFNLIQLNTPIKYTFKDNVYTVSPK